MANTPKQSPIDIEDLRKKIKEELKKEVLEEIRRELKYEEAQPETPPASAIDETYVETPAPTLPAKEGETLSISITAFLKIASHSFKYANSNIPREKWVEVIGILAGKLDTNGFPLHIADAYPMGHGTAIYAEIKDYKNYVRAYKDLKKKNLFVAGWYHSHPTYGLFMSMEDFGTQMRYQKLWDKSIALVIDPYLIDGTSYGFMIFRADLRSKKWFPVPFIVQGSLDTRTLPELLKFIYPIIEGKPLYLEYDEE
jgi:proteasome lid subunit RPN8/RPN11